MRSRSNALRAADFRRAGQEHQQRSRFRLQRAHHGCRHRPLDRLARIARQMPRLDRKIAALAFDHRRIIQELCNARAIDGRRHHQQLEVLAQTLLRVARKCEAKIGIERALVEFIEQDGADALQ